ncbi:IS3 family transposase [Rhodococcus wratislaviensis]|uniref:IS3 family transposase n=1 Tax=Rhodococcus wratislaviensis TaxID=44752 RepID=UPI00364744B9
MGYCRYTRGPTSAIGLRRQWLTGLIREKHLAFPGTYGYRRIRAELTMAGGVISSSRLISVLMTRVGIYGLAGLNTRQTTARGAIFGSTDSFVGGFGRVIVVGRLRG